MSSPPVPPPEHDDADLADRLCLIILRLSRQLRREAQKVGASASDAMLLAALTKQPGLGSSDLADREQMSRPAMIAHLNRLEEAGWIARQDTPVDGDRRRVGYEVTPDGARELGDIRRQRAAWLANQLARLDAEALAAVKAAAGPLGDIVEPRS